MLPPSPLPTAPSLRPLPGPGAAPPIPPLRVSLRRWPWKRAASIAGLIAAAAVAAYFEAPLWLTAALTAAAALALHLTIARAGGWRLFGPHLAIDPMRLARRGRVHQLRVLFLLVLLFALWQIYEEPAALTINTLAYITERYTFTFFGLLNAAVLLLAPVYVGSALAEERERKALDLLYATPLSDCEIVLGKFAGRTVVLGGFVLTGLPVLSGLQLWGGIDMPLMLANLANSVLLLLTASALCTFVSAVSRRVFWAVAASALTLAGPALASFALLVGGFGSPLVLADDRLGGQGLTIQMMPTFAFVYLAAIGAFLMASVWMVRRERSTVVGVFPAPIARRLAVAPAGALPSEDRELEHAADHQLLPPAPLPPVGTNALLWKELYTGGRTLFYTPAALCLLTVFVLPGVCVLAAKWSVPHIRQSLLWFYYVAFWVFYAGGVLLRATACVARERQLGTLDLLLQLPSGRRGILRAKWAGVLWRGWPLLLFVVADVVVGLLCGTYLPMQALWLLAAPWTLLLFLTSVGVYLSVRLPTVLRATMTLGVLLLPFLYYFVDGAFDPIRLPGQWAYAKALERVAQGFAEQPIPTRDEWIAGQLAGASLCGLYLLAALLIAWLARRRFDDASRP